MRDAVARDRQAFEFREDQACDRRVAIRGVGEIVADGGAKPAHVLPAIDEPRIFRDLRQCRCTIVRIGKVTGNRLKNVKGRYDALYRTVLVDNDGKARSFGT